MMIQNTFLNNAAMTPEKIALIFDDLSFTYGDLKNKIDSIAGYLKQMGLERGDRVVIYLPNCPYVIVGVYAVLHCDGIFVVIHSNTKPHKLSYVVNDCGAKFLITSGREFPDNETIGKFISACPSLRQVIFAFDAPESYPSFTQALAKHCVPVKSFNIDIDLAGIIYTSGSTGFPKGVTMSHLNIMSAVTSITTYLENSNDDIILNILPLSFDYGLYQLFMCYTFGGTLVLHKDFGFIYDIITSIKRYKVTGFPIVPTILGMLFKLKNPHTQELSSLRYISNTGAALPVEYIRRFRETYPSIRIYSMYGLTECKRVSYLDPSQIDKRPGSVGKAMPNTEVFIVDENGNLLDPGQTGTLMIRGASVMQGYWNDPAATEEKIRRGNYPLDRILDSGDLFRMDDEGYLYFVGRKDDMLKIKGERVAPAEVERIIQSIEGVEDAAVIGFPDEIWGTIVKAFVVVSGDNNRLTGEEILRYCKEHLEPFAVPRKICIVEALPRNDNGKVDKSKLNNELY